MSRDGQTGYSPQGACHSHQVSSVARPSAGRFEIVTFSEIEIELFENNASSAFVCERERATGVHTQKAIIIHHRRRTSPSLCYNTTRTATTTWTSTTTTYHARVV